MEKQLLTEFENAAINSRDSPPPFQALSVVLSLVSNPSTTDSSLSVILKTLTLSLQNPNHRDSHHRPILPILHLLSLRHPRLRQDVITAIHSFSLLPSVSTRSLADSLSILLSLSATDVNNESAFLSLVFRPRISIRYWLLQNVSRFVIRPSVLFTVLFGFTKDPYPNIRSAALDGLSGLCKCILIEDENLIQGCYFRAVELLFDTEDTVRCSAVRVVSECGRLLVSTNLEKSRQEWSDALFVQLCSMVRDMSVNVRIEAFHSLGNVEMVSHDILLQTLSKKASAAMKEKNFPGQLTAKSLKLPASNAAFAFVHGLEDEFHQVRSSACRALQRLTILSADFAGGAVNLLMDVLSDDSLDVRLQALETMHSMARFDHLKVQEAHLNKFVGTLLDSDVLIRSAARRVLKLTKLRTLALFRLCIDGLIKNLELYPQDEADVFSVLFSVGQKHGKFVVSMMREVSRMIEPSFGGKLSFDNVRTASLLVLAISAPVSLERHICSIQPRIFSYAVTILGRISRGLADVMDQSNLLTYLSHCSRFTFASAAEFFNGEECDLPAEEGDAYLIQRDDAFLEDCSEKVLELQRANSRQLEFNLGTPDKGGNCITLILQKVTEIWPLLELGLMDGVSNILRGLKAELRRLRSNSRFGDELIFILNYLDAIELLGRLWARLIFPRKFYSYQMGDWRLLFENLDMILKEMRYRFIGLTKEDEFHVLELKLVADTAKLCKLEAGCQYNTTKKLHSSVSLAQQLHEEGSISLSSFVTELQKALNEINMSGSATMENPFSLLSSLKQFKLRQLVLPGKLKYIEAEMDVQGTDFQNPLPFIPGLPVGISLAITVHNVSVEKRLWIKMSLEEKMTQFAFLDLRELGGDDEVRKFTIVAPFYKTPRARCFSLRVCIVIECSSDCSQMPRNCGGPKHDIAYICEEKEVFFSMVVK
ncbi:PREDICTED: protein SIEL isoform X2 [Ipomoea nil]|uniref:protein SIEL isoform X2 n=1 Tax=Ipomoea nil TaxID=35883 RepID=UPI000900B80E|nr:PREDICTED: protein SIEL isoform X2 [Ipomoea nil]